MPTLNDAARLAKQQAMLESAQRVVAERGVPGLSIRSVADGVGASTMAVYTHFGGRDQLLGALFFDALNRLGDEMQPARTIPDPFGRILALAAIYRRFAVANRGSFLVVAHLMGQAEYARAIPTGPAYAAVAEAVEHAIETGQARGEVRVLTDSLWAATQGTVHLEVVGYYARREDADARFAQLGALLLDGLRATARSP